MRVPINLASQPFRRDRPFLVASAALSIVFAALLLGLFVMFAQERRTMQESSRELTRLQREQNAIAAEQRKLDSELRQVGNADVLERSQFINVLLYRKGISWTRMFADLEKVVPSNVRIISVRPQVNAEDHIYLDMVVGAETQKPVIDLLGKLETSELFGSVAAYGILPPSQTDPLFRYRLSVSYAQKL